MRINWVLANSTTVDPSVDLNQLKTIGPFWGGWQTWRSNSTDNVICNDFDRAKSLLQRNFNQVCNFFIPNALFQTLDRPSGVRLYDGNTELDLVNREEIISMHLAGSQSDVVLLLGFDWQPTPKSDDRLIEHQAQNYRNLIRQAIKDMPDVQWVLVDHGPELMTEVKNLPNLTQDTLANVIKLLAS